MEPIAQEETWANIKGHVWLQTQLIDAGDAKMIGLNTVRG